MRYVKRLPVAAIFVILYAGLIYFASLAAMFGALAVADSARVPMLVLWLAVAFFGTLSASPTVALGWVATGKWRIASVPILATLGWLALTYPITWFDRDATRFLIYGLLVLWSVAACICGWGAWHILRHGPALPWRRAGHS